MFYLFVNKYLYVAIRLTVTTHQSTTQFERTPYPWAVILKNADNANYGCDADTDTGN